MRVRASHPQLKRDPLGAPAIAKEVTMATKVAKVIFAILGLLFAVAGLLPTLRGQAMNTRALSTAVVWFLLAVVLRPRRPRASPSGPGA